MSKLLAIFSLAIIFGLTSPLSAQAGCCKAIQADLVSKTSFWVSEASSEAQCKKDACGSWVSAIGIDKSFCQHFYYESATADIPKGACVSETTGCCQVTITTPTPKRVNDEVIFVDVVTKLNYSSNSQNECNFFCYLTNHCNSLYQKDYNPNPRTGNCEAKPAAGAAAKNATGAGISNAGAGVNPLFQFTMPSDPLKYAAYNPATVIAKVISVLLSILGTIALLMFIYAGFNWMTAMGNDTKINTAKKIMVWSTAGLVVIFISYIAAGFLLELVGVI